MGLIKGGAIRLFSTFLYFVSFICSMVIVGATGWFIASFSGSTRDFAIIGMASVAALYSFMAMLFTCCLAGISFFAVLAIFFDVVLMAAMIAIAVLNRNARFGCGGDGSIVRWRPIAAQTASVYDSHSNAIKRKLRNLATKSIHTNLVNECRPPFGSVSIANETVQYLSTGLVQNVALYHNHHDTTTIENAAELNADLKNPSRALGYGKLNNDYE
ncbi:hypothetical protein KVT40_007006 [Elsinoe batatas]|uniref:MARVEL domain-containing protein n=1 Tax=Elsinoe batatas TaxID=2601811 RepID=A0A8K0L0J6_9PEZI|nr:hypothetical protein KVT40_007006 [Elsinoe batatas]